MRATSSAKRIGVVALFMGSIGLVLALLAASSSAHSQQNELRSQTELSLRLLPGSAAVGDEWQVYIDGADLKSLYAYELKLEYDADFVKIASAASGLGSQGFPVLQERRLEGRGMLTFAYTRLGNDAGVDGNATLLELKLSLLKQGQAEIRLVSAKLIDNNLQASYWSEGLMQLIAIGPSAPSGGDGGGAGGDMPPQGAELQEQAKAWSAAGFRYRLVQTIDGVWAIELLERLDGHRQFTLSEELLSELLRDGLSSGPLAHRVPIRLDWRQVAAGTETYALRLPVSLLQQELEQTAIVLILPGATVSLPGNMFVAAAGSAPSAMAEIELRVHADALELSVHAEEADWPDSRWFHNYPLARLSYKPMRSDQPYEHQVIAQYRGKEDDGQGAPVASSFYDANRQELRFQLASPGIYTADIASASFADLAGAEWARRSIELLAARGIAHGYGEARFQPGAAVTRAEFVHMLALLMEWRSLRTADEPEMSVTDILFADVPADAYYRSSLVEARAKNVVFGTNSGRFQPDAALKREDMFVLAARALQLKLERNAADAGAPDALAQFRDSEQLSHYAVDAASVLTAYGLIRGNLAGLEPRKFATRAETAVFLARLHEYMRRS